MTGECYEGRMAADSEFPRVIACLLLAAAGVVWHGCGPDRRSVSDAGADGGWEDPAHCTVPAIQGASEPCCLAYGIDACGAGLFCAAFDGRTEPTCYVERSQMDGSECTEDRQCASGSCNGEARACRSIPTTSCEPTIGCAPLDGATYVCVDGRCARTDGGAGDPCASAGDCTTGYCVSSRCTSGSVGEPCGRPEDCSTGFCAFGECAGGAEGDRCEGADDCTSGICVGGSCSAGAVGSPCTSPDQCAEGTCARRVRAGTFLPYYEPGSGECIATCTVDGQCGSGARCVAHAALGVGVCSEGRDWHHCERDADCGVTEAQARCVVDGRGVGLCSAGYLDDPCLARADCGSGLGSCYRPPGAPEPFGLCRP